MTKMFALATAALFGVAASPVIAGETRPAPAPTTEASQTAAASARVAPSKTKYCIVESVTGSRIPVKTCATRDEWLGRGFDPLAAQ